MLSLPSSVRISLCTEPADMRRSFDGLAFLVQHILKSDPLSGHFFVFRNKSGDRVKVLFWDGDGYAIYYKRLEKGTYRFSAGGDGSVTIRAADLAMLLDGVDPRARRHAEHVRVHHLASVTSICHSPVAGDAGRR